MQGPRHTRAGSEAPFLFYIAQSGEKDGLSLGEGALWVGPSSGWSSPAQPGAPQANLGCLGVVPAPFGARGSGWDMGQG